MTRPRGAAILRSSPAASLLLPRNPMTDNDPRPRPNGRTLAISGFVLGVITVLLVVLALG